MAARQLATVMVLIGLAQQPPAAPPTTAPPASQPKPAVPIAAAALATHTDQYTGATVSLTAAVSQVIGPTVFSVAQVGQKDRAAEVLIVSAVLTGPVQPGGYVTVIGEVIRFDPDTIAARLKDAAPTLDPGIVERYRGRPAIVATSVINTAMTDLAKRLPPPMTPEEDAYSKLMKQIGPGFNTLRQAVTASSASDVASQAATLKKLFGDAVPFWKAQARTDALQWVDDAQKTAGAIEGAAARNNWDEVKSTVPKLQQICGNCHTQYRERLDDGSYRYKKPPK